MKCWKVQDLGMLRWLINYQLPATPIMRWGLYAWDVTRKPLVLNAFNQMHEVPNVFVTDGSCMTSGVLRKSFHYLHGHYSKGPAIMR